MAVEAGTSLDELEDTSLETEDSLLETTSLLEDETLVELASDEEDTELEEDDSSTEVWLEALELLSVAELLDEITLLDVSTLHAANNTRKMVKNANFFIKFSPFTCPV